jgi:phosphate:Na+ symporter
MIRFLLLLAVCLGGILLAPVPALAAEAGVSGATGAPAIDPLEITLGFIGGLALFLFGVDQLAKALKAVAGDRMKSLLARLTTNPLAGLGTGAVATAILDSSSVVIIMTIAMVHAGLLTFAQSLGIVLGANIGTTLGGQLIAMDVAKYGPVILLAGLLLHFLGRSDRQKNWGSATLGIGLVLFGLDHIGSAMEPFKTHQPFLTLMERVSSNPFYGVLLGAGFTIVIQSSSGTMGIVIVLATQGMIPLAAAVYLMLGAEIGTCADTLVASIGRSRAALRTAVFHLFFNVVTCIIGVLLATPLMAAGRWLAFGSENVGRQIANVHVLFNTTGALLFIWFVPAMAALLLKLIPDRRSASHEAEPAPAT